MLLSVLVQLGDGPVFLWHSLVPFLTSTSKLGDEPSDSCPSKEPLKGNWNIYIHVLNSCN